MTAVWSPHAKQSYSAPSVHPPPRRTQNRQQDRGNASKESQTIRTLLTCQSRVDTQGGEQPRGRTSPRRERGEAPRTPPGTTPWVAPRQAASRCGRGNTRGGSPGAAGERARRSWLRMSRSIQDTARPAGDSSRMITTGTAEIRHGRGGTTRRRWEEEAEGGGDRGRSRRALATAPMRGQRAEGSSRGATRRAVVRT